MRGCLARTCRAGPRANPERPRTSENERATRSDMLGIPIAFAVFGYGEWATHKYLLHGRGRDRRSRFSFHYHDHHQAVRRNGGYDPAYEGPVWSSTTQAREAIGLAAIGLAHLPLLPIAPFYTGAIWYCL